MKRSTKLINTQPSSRKKRTITINQIRNGKEVTMDIIEEIEKFLEKYSLPRLNWKEIEKMNGPITRTETETVIKKLPTNKIQDQMASQANSIKHLAKS